MKKNTFYILVSMGILLFFAGLIIRSVYQFVWLIPLATALTLTGIVQFFRVTDFRTEFIFDVRDDIMTYFWNVIVLKLWSFIFIVWMLAENFSMFIQGRMPH